MEIAKQTLNGRIMWLDWMKVWATLAVIWGHFFSKGDIYVFVFNLQVFCVISGFLYKKAPDWKTCIRKCFWQLLVPTVILSILMHLEAYFRCMALGTSYDISLPWFFEWLLLGHRWCMGPCWYFYTLIVIRIIMQLLPERRWIYGLVFVALSAIAIYMHQIGFEMSNSNVNVVVCMPFFLLGIFLKPLKKSLVNMKNLWVEALLFVLGVAGVYFSARFNGYVWMYLNGIGNNYALFILGGFSGTCMLYAVSLWLSRLPYHHMAQTLSKGSIAIIGLHIIIVRRLTELPDRMWGEDLLWAILILVAFVPIIQLAERFCPIILGQKK